MSAHISSIAMKSDTTDVLEGSRILQDIDSAICDIPVVVVDKQFGRDAVLLELLPDSDGKFGLLVSTQEHAGIVRRRKGGLILHGNGIKGKAPD